MEKKIIMISLFGAVVLAALIAGAIALKKSGLTAPSTGTIRGMSSMIPAPERTCWCAAAS